MTPEELHKAVAMELRRHATIPHLSFSDQATLLLRVVREAMREPSEEMRRATWVAQYRFANALLPEPKPDATCEALAEERVASAKPRGQDHAAFAATLAASPLAARKQEAPRDGE